MNIHNNTARIFLYKWRWYENTSTSTLNWYYKHFEQYVVYRYYAIRNYLSYHL